MHCFLKLHLFNNTSFSMTVYFWLQNFLNFGIFPNYSLKPDGIYQRAASNENIHTDTLSSLREGYKIFCWIFDHDLTSVCLDPPPPFFCDTIIALGLVIVRPCGELQNSGPAGRRDKTTHFYSKRAHIEQQNYKMTENARESITIFFTGQIA